MQYFSRLKIMTTTLVIIVLAILQGEFVCAIDTQQLSSRHTNGKPTENTAIQTHLSEPNELAAKVDESTVPPSEGGNDFSGCGMSKLVRDYFDSAAIGKTGSCHLFRHTMATLMLEGGADIRFIQAMLGHSNLETTKFIPAFRSASCRRSTPRHIQPAMSAKKATKQVRLASCCLIG